MVESLLPGASPAGEGVLLVAVLLGASLLLALLARAAMRRPQGLAAPEVQERLDAGLDMLVLDTRPPEVFALGHIATAVNVPLPALRQALSDPSSVLPADREQLIVVVAESARCVRRCVDFLRRAGYARVRVIDGGMQGWCEDRLPTCQHAAAGPGAHG